MLFWFFTKSGVLYNLVIIIISQANYEHTLNRESSDFLQIGFLAFFLIFYLSQKLHCEYEKMKKDREINKRLTRVNFLYTLKIFIHISLEKIIKFGKSHIKYEKIRRKKLQVLFLSLFKKKMKFL